MGARRAIGMTTFALTTAALFVAAPPRPAQAQVAPVITINPASGTADAPGSTATWSITVSGTNFFANQGGIQISFGGVNVTPSPAPATNGQGSFTAVVTPARRTAGQYAVTATQTLPTGATRTASATFTAIPVLTLDPPCSTTGVSQSLTVSGSGWGPGFAVTVTYDYPSNTTQTVNAAKDGTFSVTFTVTPPNRDVVIAADQPRTQSSVRVTWSPCPPPGVTTTTSTTLATITTVTIAPTTTAKPKGTTTTSPVVTIPPTAGVTLTVTPPLGPPGFVAKATGTGFPPGPVVLSWLPGTGTFNATADASGMFDTQVLVFPRDVLGPRRLIATAGTVNANTDFLVVPNTIQPSGKEVAQITRIRRFLQR